MKRCDAVSHQWEAILDFFSESKGSGLFVLACWLFPNSPNYCLRTMHECLKNMEAVYSWSMHSSRTNGCTSHKRDCTNAHGGELPAKLAALAATEWKWLPRCAQEMPILVSIIHRRTKVIEEKIIKKKPSMRYVEKNPEQMKAPC